MSAALIVQVDASVLARLDALATERGATRDAIVGIALQDLLDSTDTDAPELADWQLALVDEGLAEAERGDFACPDEVEAIFVKHRG